jgi:very-short-patch-repair endonuclease
LRQEVLERLGWRVHRVWSTDWFRDPQGETSRVVSRIEAARG